MFDPNITGLVSFFRMVTSAGVDKWLAWTKDIDIIRGPIAGDTTQRIYWTGDFEPRMSNITDVFLGAGPWPGGSGSLQYVLGVFAPTAAMTVTPPGGTGSTRSYVYTFVTPFGEESQPSPPSAATTSGAGTWALSVMEVMPANSFAVTAASWATGVATLTGAAGSGRGWRVGEEANISSVNPAGYNVRGAVLSVLSNGITIAIAVNPGAYVSGGTVARVGIHNITNANKRIYRTITDADGSTQFRFVAEITAATTTYNDAITDAVVAVAIKLPSTNWAMPPVDGLAIGLMANGIPYMASKNEFVFGEINRPHAWPVGYRQVAKGCTRIVGMGSFGSTVVAPTDGAPNYITGVDPSTMGGGAQTVEEGWPCVSKRGIVQTSYGVMFPVPQGYALIGVNGPSLVTREFFTTEEWRQLIPSTAIGAIHDNRVYLAFTIDANTSAILVIDKNEFASLTRVDVKIGEMWTDPLSALLYVGVDDNINQWDSPLALRLVTDWWSKEWALPAPKKIGAARVTAEFTQTSEQIAAALAARNAAIAANQALIDSGYIGAAAGAESTNTIEGDGSLLTVPPELTYDSIQFQIYSDNVLKFSKTVVGSGWFKCEVGSVDNYSVRIATNTRVTDIQVAESIRQGRGV